MENKKDNIKRKKNNIFILYYVFMTLLITNMIFIFIGHKTDINLFLPLLIEMILYITFLFIWVKSNNQNEKNNVHIRKPLYICIALLIIHMSFNVVIYKIELTLTFAQDLLIIIIEFILFMIVLSSITRYKDELLKCKSTREQTNIDKFFKLTSYITIMIWFIFIIVN